MEQYKRKLLTAEILDKMTLNNLTSKAAAKEIGIAETTFSHTINHYAMPNVYHYYKICKWLCRPFDYFINE